MKNAKYKTKMDWQDDVKISGGYAKYRTELLNMLTEFEYM